MGERGAGVLRCPLGEKCAYTTQPGENNNDTKALGEKRFRTTAFLAQMRAGACLGGTGGATAPLRGLMGGDNHAIMGFVRSYECFSRPRVSYQCSFRPRGSYEGGFRPQCSYERVLRAGCLLRGTVVDVCKGHVLRAGVRRRRGRVRACVLERAFLARGFVWTRPCPSPPPHGSGHFSRAPRRLRALDGPWAWDQGGLGVVGRLRARGWAPRTWLVYTRPAI